MKSIISNHEASKEEVLRRVNEVMVCGSVCYFREFGNLIIVSYKLGNNKYIITGINENVLTFELENVYFFKF